MNTAKEYWGIIVAGANRAVGMPSAFGDVAEQVSGLVDDCGDTAADTQGLITQIIDLPFPESLGLVDSQEYDTVCAGIISGLQTVVVNQGGTPAPLPDNAPRASKLVRSGIMSYYDGSGTARARDQNAKEWTKADEIRQSNVDGMDTTKAAKEALAAAFAGQGDGGEPGAWKRKSKFKQGEQVVRVFGTKGGLTATAVFNPDADEPDEAMFVVPGATEQASPGKFPRPLAKNFSGKTIFIWGDYGADGKLDFYCGPEDTEGRMDDGGDSVTGDTLEYIFKDHEIEVAASENHHIITCNDGETLEELKKVVFERLVAAGGRYDGEDEPLPGRASTTPAQEITGGRSIN